jgi:signal transduction histidine kinase
VDTGGSIVIAIAAHGEPPAIESAASALGFALVRAMDATMAIAQLDSVAAGLEVVAIVIAVAGVVPLTTARRIHAAAPEVHLVFVVDPDGQDELRRQLALDPQIGTGWTTARADADTIVTALRDAARWTRQRLRTRATLARARTRPITLSPRAAPAPIESAALGVRLGLLARELRESIVPITTAVGTLSATTTTPADRDHNLGVISQQVSTLSHLIDDLGDVSRLLSGTLQLSRERFAIAEVIARSVATVKPAFDRSGLELTTAVPAEPMWLDADRARIEQVVTHLLDNAGRYTDRGGRIWITAAPVGGTTTSGGRRVVIAVRDTGIGVTDELRGGLFELFAHAPPDGPARERGGLGVGLMLVKRLVELHGGEVAAASLGLNKGSEFSIRLPLVEAAVVSSP